MEGPVLRMSLSVRDKMGSSVALVTTFVPPGAMSRYYYARENPRELSSDSLKWPPIGVDEGILVNRTAKQVIGRYTYGSIGIHG